MVPKTMRASRARTLPSGRPRGCRTKGTTGGAFVVVMRWLQCMVQRSGLRKPGGDSRAARSASNEGRESAQIPRTPDTGPWTLVSLLEGRAILQSSGVGAEWAAGESPILECLALLG